MESNYQEQTQGAYPKASAHLGSTDNYNNSIDKDVFSMHSQKGQKLTFGEVALFILQVAALVTLFMYIYRTPANDSEKEVKGYTISKEISGV